MASTSRLAREPLVHFMLIGAAVFAFYALVSWPATTPADDEIVVTPGDALQLADRFAAIWLRPPSPDELDSLIDEDIREEVLVREALNLSMDRDDPVIRQRLVQKMTFLMESAAGAMVPAEAELQAYYETHAADYARGTRLAFEQVFLGEAPSAAEVAEALAVLREGVPPATVERGSLLPPAMPLAGAQPVDGTFGTGFFAALDGVDPGAWAGPVRSGYGLHLVRVTEREPGGMPAFAEIREQVEADWRRQKAAELAEAQYRRLAEAYAIRRPDGSAVAAQ